MVNIGLYEKAEQLFVSSKYSEAEKIYETISNIKENCDVFHNYGICLAKLGKCDRAIEVFMEITKIYPDFGKAWYSLGVTCLIKEEIQQAIEYFSRAKEILVDDAKVYFYSALSYEILKNYDKAIEDYKTSLKLDDNFQTHMNLGLCYYDIRDIHSALEHTRMAFELNPDDLDSLRYYVYILIKANQRTEAYNILLKSVLNYDEDVTILEFLVLLALDSKDFDVADKAYDKLKKVSDVDYELLDYEKLKKVATNNSGDVFKIN